MGRAGAVIAFAAAAAAAHAGTACTTHPCDPVTISYSKGEMVPGDQNAFETSPLDSPDKPWMDYPGGATIVVTFPPEAAGRTIDGIESWVGVSAQPNQGSDNWTSAGGQLAELSEAGTGSADAGAGGFSVTNATCEKYFARFVVRFVPVDGGVATGDAAAAAGDATE